ncbi:MAG: hypothetical protein BGO76_08285 [Caedibacter sp. 38-128]|nr:MAG: hypothetical protein BGO76_08285 [Caedibacter sp. 38-128]
MVRRPDFSLRFEVLDRIKAKVLSIVKERVEFQDGSGIDPIQKLIENAVAQNEPWGYFLQALGLKYGILGYPQNIVKARKFIRDNYISY